MTQSETTSAAGGGEAFAALRDARLWVEHAITPLRGLSPAACEPGEALLKRIDAALAAPTAKGGTTWRPMSTAPRDGKTQIVAKHRPNEHTPDGWIATITIDPDDGEYRRGGLDTIKHYNGDALMHGFHGVWTGWLYPHEVASPSPPAGAAGGGSGDLGALSAGATPGPWRTGTTRLHNPDLLERSPFVPAISPDRPYAGMILRGTGLTKEEDTAFIVALVNAYRSGRLIEAPTPDLGAQGEPVAWAWEFLSESTREWVSVVDDAPPRGSYEYRNIRPLYEAPAAPRLGSGVSVEEIAAVLWNNRHTRYSGIKFETAKSFGATYSQSDFKASVAAVYEDARAILALIAQAPRDGGETQGGWQPIETAPKDGTRILVEFDRGVGVHAVTWEESVSGTTIWCVDDNKHGPYPLRGYMEELRWRPLPTPPSGVETIRQDNTSGGK